nr:2-oxoacid:acceptor oxidoreductase family protein [uncultured Desulfobulbus sp.]
MYRIRFHARGGQGIKTASRIIGTALFLAGFDVQDAPRYGAERRGAPLFAYVRADRQPVNERGIILSPDLVVVSDENLVTMASGGVAAGVDQQTVVVLFSEQVEALWRKELPQAGRIVLFRPLTEEERPYIGVACAAAAARLLGLVSLDHLLEAVTKELASLGKATVAANLGVARRAYEEGADQAGIVHERKDLLASQWPRPQWIDLPFEPATVSAPVIVGACTSEIVPTGLWRSRRPVIDRDRCRRCWWICSTLCPDGAIQVDAEKRPIIDYQHCKGCMVCMSQCPAQAISAQPESEAHGGEEP